MATVYTRMKDEQAGKVKFPVDPWWKELFPDVRIVYLSTPHSLLSDFPFVTPILFSVQSNPT